MARKHSESTRKKMSESHTGKVLSEETKQKIRASMLEYWEEKKQTVEALRAAGFEIKYYTHTEEAKQKMREAAKGRNMDKAREQLEEKRKQQTEQKLTKHEEELLRIWKTQGDTRT